MNNRCRAPIEERDPSLKKKRRKRLIEPPMVFGDEPVFPHSDSEDLPDYMEDITKAGKLPIVHAKGENPCDL